MTRTKLTGAQIIYPGLVGTPVTSNSVSANFTNTLITLLTLTVTVTQAMVDSGRKFKLKGWLPQVYSTVDTDRADVHIKESTTDLAVAYGRTPLPANGGWGSVNIETPAIAMPSVGSHTYTLQIARGTGTGTLTVYAGTETAMFLEAYVV